MLVKDKATCVLDVAWAVKPVAAFSTATDPVSDTVKGLWPVAESLVGIVNVPGNDPVVVVGVNVTLIVQLAPGATVVQVLAETA